MDQGVSLPNNSLHSTATRVMIQSRTLNYHITKLESMNLTSLNSEFYDTLRFDAETGFNIS